MTNETLAIFGGKPVRETPFSVGPMIDDDEEAMVLAAIREHNFSRYIGSSGPTIEEDLRMPSAAAAAVEADWHFLGGPNVRKFAAEFAEKFSVPFAIPVNSATSGLSTALAAADVGAGDEVILPALSFSASGSAVLLFNSIPVFVDVDPETFCIDPAAVERAITPRTKAIMPVHLLGNACDMTAIMEIAKRYGLKVIEDCAQGPGVTYQDRPIGTIGDAGVFSFQQSKNIMTGEGGMIVTSDPEIARKARLILNHGETVMEDHHDIDELANVVGCNFRMPELCAALGRAQLKKLDAVNQWRSENYQILAQRMGALPGFSPPHVPQAVGYISHVAGFLYDAAETGLPRDLLVAALRAEGVPVGTGYVRLMYENPTFLKRIAFGAEGSPWTDGPEESPVTYARGQCPIAEGLIYEKFLWFYHIAHPSTAQDMGDIVDAVEKILAGAADIVAGADTIRATNMVARAQGRI